ncbi:hypothetical protein FIBSPDRAFT_592713 [Athelia psychrophila]|uniref:Uncharacterized protein n=1 Tax=Athelia psychrophila TaxID=1759441 RepID=A0A166H4R8_9AGAM|nr:hypothetical protein FIBSPDRAFT_592713 [Fibularhizoctonia sp. CBS 109695]
MLAALLQTPSILDYSLGCSQYSSYLAKFGHGFTDNTAPMCSHHFVGRDEDDTTRPSSPFVGHDADIVDKIDTMALALEARAAALVTAAAIIGSQIPYCNSVWMRSITTRDVGADMHNLVLDIRRHESTGRQRDNTWAATGNPEAQRRAQNTMGFQVRTGSEAPSPAPPT